MRRLVDIFCGCGGLSLGFDLLDEQRQFETVLAIDNEPSAVRLFNANFDKLQNHTEREIARTADICWFESVAEIRLFYLSHMASRLRDDWLQSELLKLGFGVFLQKLRELDQRCESHLSALSGSLAFRRSASAVVAAAPLALVKKAARTLGLKSFHKPAVDLRGLPWAVEAADPFWAEEVGASSADPTARVSPNAATLWAAAIAPLTAAADKLGRGQHVGNAAKCASLLSFFSSPTGAELERIVTEWRSQRRTLVAAFSSETATDLQHLYASRYQVSGLLGGPPCKGFSRIGRPVANSLREQGVFAWSSDEFGDERNKLVLHYVMFLEALRPDFFVFENVSNFQSSLKTPDGTLQADEVLAEAVKNLSGGALTYNISARQLSANDFSIPQSRIRYIMFGVNGSRTSAAAEDFFKLQPAQRELGVAEALFGLPKPSEFRQGEHGQPDTVVECSKISPPDSDEALRTYFKWVQQPLGAAQRVDAHVYRRMREDDAAFFRFVGPGIRWMDWELRGSPTLKMIQSALGKRSKAPVAEANLALRLILEETQHRYGLVEQHLLNPSYLKNGSGSHGDWLERLAGDRPAKTIVAHIGKDTYGYLHPYDNRPITIREAARLQSFPDAFSFGCCGVVDAYTAIGNAVPPLLAHVFAQQVASLLYGGTARSDHENIIEMPVRRPRRQRR